MNANNFSLEMLRKMRYSPIRNYAIPGLTSWLIGSPSPNGFLRMFECSRDHQEAITPHSHRFDFQCWVLSGSVINRVWTRSYGNGGDWFKKSTLEYGGDNGQYSKVESESAERWEYTDSKYSDGDCYSMKRCQVHSIYFSRGTQVLFFEGPTESNSSVIIEPWIDGEIVPTFKVEPWMFKRQQT